MLVGYKRGQGSIVLRVKILNSSVATGAGLTGLTSSSTGLIISTMADTEATATAYTVAASNVETITTLGTYAAPSSGKCRFKEVDATNHKGVYEIQIADARFNVASAKSLLVSISGATNAAETDVVIPLRDLDPFDAVRAGLTALPNVASGSAGAIITSGTGTAQLSVTSGRALANTDQLAGQTVTAAAGVTFPTSVASPTNITAGTITTVTTVTNRVTANTDQWGGVTVTGMPMPTYTQPTGFLTATFPTTVASPTNITAGTITTVGTVTNAVTVGTNNDKTGYSLLQSFPTNFASLGINASGHISRVTLCDTTTTNTDMRGTDNAALASAWTATRAGYLDSVLMAANANQRTVNVTGSNHVAADMHESQVGSIHATTFDAGAIDAAALASDAATEIATAVIGATVEGSETLQQSVRLMRASLVGKLSGAATTTVTIRDAADSKNRITATVTADGDRTAVTTDAT
jgi:hypothetical protein